MRKIYVYISNTLLEEGRRPSLEEVAEKTVQPLEVVKQVLDVFESVAGIYRDPVFKRESSTWISMFPRLGSSRLPKTSRFEAAVPVPMSTRPERVPSR